MDSISKFYGKSNAYEKGRPSYPKELIDYLYKNHGFSADSVIADIGSGTGKFAELLLEMGSEVIGVEPNGDMRKKAEENLSKYEKFNSVCGYADNTSLPDLSVDFVTAAQSFHWFDTEKFKTECRRILKPNGKVALIWNFRIMSSEFNRDWHSVFEKYCPDFRGFSAGMSDDSEDIKYFFNNDYIKKEFLNPIPMDREKFIKRSLSSSYSLCQSDTYFTDYIGALNGVFDKHCDKYGLLSIENKTSVYIGKIK